MPLLQNAKKALRVSQRKQAVNQRIKSQVKTAADAFAAKPGADSLAAAASSIDRAVKRGLFHRNKAARLKSQLAKRLKQK